jgi:hypothetical protein
MPFYTDSDSLAPRIPPLGLPGMDVALGGFLHFGQVIVAAGDDTGNSSDVHGPIPDTAPAATSDTDVDMLLDSAETVDIFRVEATASAPIWVVAVRANIVTAFNASVTITVGDTNDALGWVQSTDFGPTATSTNLNFGTVYTAVPTSDNQSHYNLRSGRTWAASSGHIGIVMVTDPTAGRLAVYAAYAQIFRASSA